MYFSYWRHKCQIEVSDLMCLPELAVSVWYGIGFDQTVPQLWDYSSISAIKQ